MITKERALYYVRMFEELTIKAGTSKSIETVKNSFFDTIIRVLNAINPKESEAMEIVVKIAEAGKFLALNTFDNEKLSAENTKYFGEGYNILNMLLDDFLIHARPVVISVSDSMAELANERRFSWSERVAAITEFLCVNQREARKVYAVRRETNRKSFIISKPENIVGLLEFMDEHWEALEQGGFNEKFFPAYAESVLWRRQGGEEPDDDSKTSELFSIMQGELKLVPAYKRVRESYLVCEAGGGYSELRYYMDTSEHSETYCVEIDADAG